MPPAQQKQRRGIKGKKGPPQQQRKKRQVPKKQTFEVVSKKAVARRMRQGPKLVHVMCPSFSALPAVRFPVQFRFTITLGSSTVYGVPNAYTAQSAILVLAPFNDCLGGLYIQTQSGSTPAAATGLPDATSPMTNTNIIDPYITNLLTPVSITGAANVPSARWTDFCVELLETDAIAGIYSSIQAGRWLQEGVPLVSSGTSVQYKSTFDSLSEMRNASGMGVNEVPLAALASGLCYKTAMVDRNALEFTPVGLGSVPWVALYGNTSAQTSIGTFSPWAPIVLSIQCPPPGTVPGIVQTGSGSGNAINIRCVVKGMIEVAAAPNTFMSRMAKTIPRGGPNAEHAWLNAQDRILKTGFQPLPHNMMGRTPAGMLGYGQR